MAIDRTRIAQVYQKLNIFDREICNLLKLCTVKKKKLWINEAREMTSWLMATSDIFRSDIFQ